MSTMETSTSENLTLTVSRVVKASRERVFAAWTNAEQMMRWFAPGPMQPTTVDVDLREGGQFRAAMQGPSPRTGQEMCVTFTGTYQRIVAEELLVFSWEVEGDPGDPTLVTVMFAEVEGGTEVTLKHERVPNVELVNRNRFGWTAMLEKLDKVCSE